MGSGIDDGIKQRRLRIKGRAVSPITRRILAVNMLALAILVAGLLYLDAYRQGLIESELASLRVQADLFAAALGESAIAVSERGDEVLLRGTTQHMIRRMAESSGSRARLYDIDGRLAADSRMLGGRGRIVEVEDLPPPPEKQGLAERLLGLYDRLVKYLPGGESAPMYYESPRQMAQDYPEVADVLAGRMAGAAAVRKKIRGGMVLSVAVPVQHYKHMLGVLMLSKGSREIDAALLDVRINILEMFAVALAITTLLSVYLARTIARPILRLASAADLVRRGRNRQHAIPDFAGRGDEIEDLALALRDMTQALWDRMDAIDRFAADVAHEIKNPLTSLRSAVETAAVVSDPEQQRRLMSIIQDDVQRLDRLITDISLASRLDAELSRAEKGPVRLSDLLATLVDVYDATRKEQSPRLILRDEAPTVIDGIEDRLMRVMQNLIANAVSFSPPEGEIVIRTQKKDEGVEVTVEDQGPGIPPGKEESIFDRFYSERPTSEKFGTHSGLGLSISRQIVEAHGGSIFAENREGGGARLVVRLPGRQFR